MVYDLVITYGLTLRLKTVLGEDINDGDTIKTKYSSIHLISLLSRQLTESKSEFEYLD